MKNKINLKSWWQINYRWFLSLSAFIIACLILAYAISQGSFKDMAQAYADPVLFQKAITEANKNDEVIQILGTLEPLDNMAILEGNTRYSNDNKAIEATVRVTGKKAKGKMDISAQKIGSEWKYEGIKIRVHETKQEIIIRK
ncbi:putative negative regulator of RcsB-dependent stress response [Flavobacterium sp. 28YEA47A]|uniref:cytochrome c oxidase assembly factor Coa1 family protein n=1 Tax=Flavobacterium sp. 28YEA47A TaxID=3156276 RepID=UPI0035188FE3